MDLLAEGDGAEDLTEEMKEKLRKHFIPSESNEEGPTPDHITNGLEWTAGKAEAEPEAVRVRQKVPTERSSEESSEEEDEWTRRSRRLRKRRPASRSLRRSKVEDRSTWFTAAWEVMKQILKNVLCIWGIICLLAIIPASEVKAEDAVVTGYDCLRPMSSRVIAAEDMHLDTGTCWSLVHEGVYRGDHSCGIHQELSLIHI